jgi:hypothetical protein
VKRYFTTLMAAILLVAALPGTAAATDVVCTVDNGAVNGSDSLGGAFPGTDNPNNDTGSYSVDNIWHDATEYEWCSPSRDWFKDRYLKWSTTAVNLLKANRNAWTIQVEQDVLPADSYNYAGTRDSSLPYTDFYVADAVEQAHDGYEDVSFGIYDPGTIAANVNYYAYLQWEQEADGGFLDFSPLLNYVDTKVTKGTKLYLLINYDIIGRWHKKIANNK